jgi:hypothetical protein
VNKGVSQASSALTFSVMHKGANIIGGEQANIDS